MRCHRARSREQKGNNSPCRPSRDLQRPQRAPANSAVAQEVRVAAPPRAEAAQASRPSRVAAHAWCRQTRSASAGQQPRSCSRSAHVSPPQRSPRARYRAPTADRRRCRPASCAGGGRVRSPGSANPARGGRCPRPQVDAPAVRPPRPARPGARSSASPVRRRRARAGFPPPRARAAPRVTCRPSTSRTEGACSQGNQQMAPSGSPAPPARAGMDPTPQASNSPPRPGPKEAARSGKAPPPGHSDPFGPRPSTSRATVRWRGRASRNFARPLPRAMASFAKVPRRRSPAGPPPAGSDPRAGLGGTRH